MSKKLKKNVPVLRFPDFIEPWLIKSVSELVKENFIYKPLDGNHGNLHPTSFDYVKSGIPFVMSNNIQNGVIKYSECPYISEDLARSLQKGFSKEGDVLLTHKGTVGEVAIVGPTPFPFIMLTPQVTYYRVKNLKLLSNLFLASFFVSSNFQKMLKVLAAGGTRPYIGITEQGKLNISIPSVKEQEKIASFLGAVDTRLNQLRRKLEDLQTYKRGVMQKLFSQQIRFTQPDGSPFPPWEKKKLEDIVDSVSSGRSKAIKEVGDYPVYGSTGIIGTSEMGDYSGEAILIARVGANAGKISHASGVYGVTDNTIIIKVKSPNNVYLFRTQLEIKRLNSMVFGSGQPLITGTQIKKLEIIFPSLHEEQEKIANFLTTIDCKIETLSRQIDQTEQFKKGLLQKLFV
ncbi:restriction endonuclease subunit S [Laspinema sp. A4]|uniref:restriction endonuclease subunit S n=1 Tax=Laspinema sp. D2d TaxID=2953686 RepID=UPI0021BB8CE2|nr:restriction endonuclease subunit S [Laspinema sp. D2d]MCT7984723.1 restriction endonuclease subunit S [Laspinema sp. D2d]